jgi:hypothetical protein
MMRTPGPWVAWPGTPGCLPLPQTCGTLPTPYWKPLPGVVTGCRRRSCGKAGNATLPRPARPGPSAGILRRQGAHLPGTLLVSSRLGILGFTGCSLWIDLAQQVTVVLCTNRVHPSRQATGIASLRPAVHNIIMRALGVATT